MRLPAGLDLSHQALGCISKARRVCARVCLFTGAAVDVVRLLPKGVVEVGRGRARVALAAPVFRYRTVRRQCPGFACFGRVEASRAPDQASLSLAHPGVCPCARGSRPRMTRATIGSRSSRSRERPPWAPAVDARSAARRRRRP